MSKVKKITTVAPMAYSALQNPKSREAVLNGLGKVVTKLDAMSVNHKDPVVGSITGKPVNAAQMNKLDKAASKLPKNSFDILNNGVKKGYDSLVKYDTKIKSQGH